MKNNGFTLTSALISVLIMGMAFSAMIAMITTQQKEGKDIYQKIGRSSLKYAILQNLFNPEHCLCQFDPSKRTPMSSDPKLTINTTITSTDPGDEINLGIFRHGCTQDNILAQENEKIKGTGGLTASTIKVSKIKDTGVADNYVGDLTIHFSQDGLIRALNPIEVSMLFTVDPNDPANARTILTCGAYDKDSALLGRLTDFEGRLSDLEVIEPSTLKCLPTLAQAMTTAGVTDVGPCPSNQTCQNQSVNYRVVSTNGDTCSDQTHTVCASCVAAQQPCGIHPHGKVLRSFYFGSGGSFAGCSCKWICHNGSVRKRYNGCSIHGKTHCTQHIGATYP